jgi:hypothetical protein
MSASEHEPVEQKSTIKVTRNAKGEAQFEAKVVHGVTDDELADLRRQAVAHYNALNRELGGAA